MEPSGAELAQPAGEMEEAGETFREPDPRGRIFRDTEGLIRVETVAVPESRFPPRSVRVHLYFEPVASVKTARLIATRIL